MVLNTSGSLPLWHLQKEIRSLVELARRADAEGIKLKLQRIVPEYTPEIRGQRSAKSEISKQQKVRHSLQRRSIAQRA